MNSEKKSIKLWIPFSVIILTYLLDQITKILVVKYIKKGTELVNILGDIVQFMYIENDGMAFGLGSKMDSLSKDIIFTLLTFSAIIVVIYFYKRIRQDNILAKTSFAMILGGALGNFSDKVFGFIIFQHKFQIIGKVDASDEIGLYGRVVDFIRVYIGGVGQLIFGHDYWPVFNVADIGVTIGVILLLIMMIFKKEEDIFSINTPRKDKSVTSTTNEMKKV